MYFEYIHDFYTCIHAFVVISYCLLIIVFYLQVGNFMQFIRIIVIDELQMCNKYENYHLYMHFLISLKLSFLGENSKVRYTKVFLHNYTDI